MYYTKFNTWLCEIILAGDEKGLAHLYLNTGQGSRQFEIQDSWELKPEFFKDTQSQILEYLAGKRTVFQVSLNLAGTEFQKKVWAQLRTIPYNTLAGYGEIAKKLGNPKGCQGSWGSQTGIIPSPSSSPATGWWGPTATSPDLPTAWPLRRKLIALEQGASSMIKFLLICPTSALEKIF